MKFDDALRKRLFANLSHFENVPAEDNAPRRAAVAVIVTPSHEDETRASFVLTKRTAKLRRHSGQWALPGGRLDEGETAFEAAVRECQEELGLSLNEDSHLGPLDEYVTRSGFVISPFVFWLPDISALRPDPDEIAFVQHVPLQELERSDSPIFLNGPDPARPIIRILIGDRQVHAPTGALIYQFHEVAVKGNDTRVAHLDQPEFAWK